MNLVLQNQDTRKCIWITNIQIKPRPNLIAVCIVLSCIYCLSFTVGYRNIKPKRKNSVKQSRLDVKIWRQLLNFLWRVYLLQRCTDCCYLLHRKTVHRQFWSLLYFMYVYLFYVYSDSTAEVCVQSFISHLLLQAVWTFFLLHEM